MKPWREVAVPHTDVLHGTFQQAEFAADIAAVRRGTAPREYQDAAAFYQRTFITEGMRLLLISVARRLNGLGGDPVIQLQTAFGGGKTHTMLAVYHLATRAGALSELPGIPSLLDGAELLDVPRARVVVLDGNELAPGQPWQRGTRQANTLPVKTLPEKTVQVKTLWGELAWQLGGEDAFLRVQEADATGTSPGKEVLKALLETYAPCIILVDELVAYIRQFSDGLRLSGGTYESNLSFVQALTEALKGVPTAQLLASLPESESEVGGLHGVGVLKALEKTFGRVQALWKPVATEEAFEIVRRRLFEPISDTRARDEVCRAFADAYQSEGERLPSETQESRYLERLRQAYPIHPEVFDRLYEDWTCLESFQRTRGVLKLMARVIYKLWKDQNQDLLILPGSLPLSDPGTRNELTYYLAQGWDPVIERDIDGDRAETTELENREPRFGKVNAARRVARTLFLGSAPSAAVGNKGIRGLDRARILLGCMQPEHSSAIFADALSRLVDRLHHLNASGEKSLSTTRFWFDTRANLRREMEDRKRRFQEKEDLRPRIAEALKSLTRGLTLFDGVHIFVGHGDVSDDSALRLVFLTPDKFYSKAESRGVQDEVQEYLRLNGSKPRYRANRLLFVAAEYALVSRLHEAVRTALAWASIVDDIKEKRLVIDQLQQDQAHKESSTAAEVVSRVTRDCYKCLLCPTKRAATDRQIELEAFTIPTTGGSLVSELERLCRENELVIETWAPVHLRDQLSELYWKDGHTAVKALTFWEDSLRYLYLPRLRTKQTFEKALQNGVRTGEFFGTAQAQNGERYEGFHRTAPQVQLHDSLLLIEPGAADAYVKRLKEEDRAAEAQRRAEEAERQGQSPLPPGEGGTLETPLAPMGVQYTSEGRSESLPRGADSRGSASLFTREKASALSDRPQKKATEFFGTFEITASTAKRRLIELSDEVIALLAKDPKGSVRVTVSIDAEFPEGAEESLRRAVSENAQTLGCRDGRWE